MSPVVPEVDAAPAGLVGWATTGDGRRVQYERIGFGPAALVLIHGGMCDRSYWQGQTAEFARDFCVLLIDLPGHGQSEQPASAWTIEALGADVAVAVRQAFDGPLFLVGHSVGGAIALEAARCLQGVAGVLVLDFLHQPSAAPAAPTMPAGAAAADPQAMRMAMAAGMRKGMFTADCDDAFAHRLIEKMLAFSPASGAAMRAAVASYDAASSLRALAHVPVALVQSDRRPTDVADVAAAHPGTRVWTLENTGHFLMLERPLAVNAILRAELLMMQNALTVVNA